MTKNFVVTILCSLALLSCDMRSDSSKNTRGDNDSLTSNFTAAKMDSIKDINILDSLEMDPSLGELMERKFQGILPAASCPGIEYTLLLYNQKFSGDGVYKLTARYIEAENGKDSVTISYGNQYTLRGDATNKDAVVYQLISFKSSDLINILLLKDGNLEMLNKEFERAESKLNYTLKLQ